MFCFCYVYILKSITHTGIEKIFIFIFFEENGRGLIFEKDFPNE